MSKRQPYLPSTLATTALISIDQAVAHTHTKGTDYTFVRISEPLVLEV